MMLKEWVHSLTGLFFPNLCVLCKQELVSDERHLCSSCLLELPQTNFPNPNDNALSQKLKGRFDFKGAIALYYFNTESKIQAILHEIKYRDNKSLARFLGELMALKAGASLKDIDVIVPVPLHKRRMADRGYNQSELLAQGLGRCLDIPIDTSCVERIKYTETQTHKSRSERVENMQGAFHWHDAHHGKNILLLDDVITTGSTLESIVLARSANSCGAVHILSFAAALES